MKTEKGRYSGRLGRDKILETPKNILFKFSEIEKKNFNNEKT